MSGFDAAVPQYNPASQHGPSGSGTVVWDSASSAARMAPVPRSLRGKRGSGDGSPAQQNPFEQHPIDRQASGKAPRASESDQTAPTVARSSGLSRWTSESRRFRGLLRLCWHSTDHCCISPFVVWGSSARYSEQCRVAWPARRMTRNASLQSSQ